MPFGRYLIQDHCVKLREVAKERILDSEQASVDRVTSSVVVNKVNISLGITKKYYC